MNSAVSVFNKSEVVKTVLTVLNDANGKDLEKYTNYLEVLKKTGHPGRPELVKAPKKADMTPQVKAQYDMAKAAREVQMNEYNAYVNPEFADQQNKYRLKKKLLSLVAYLEDRNRFLAKSSPTPKEITGNQENDAVIANLQAVLTGRKQALKSKKAGSTADKLMTALNGFNTALGVYFKNEVSGIDLDNLQAVKDRIDRIPSEVTFPFEQKALAKKRCVLFTAEAKVALCILLEYICRERFGKAIGEAIQNNSHSIVPEFLCSISAQFDTKSALEGLDVMRVVLERKNRYKEYLARKNLKFNMEISVSKAEAITSGKKYKKPKLNYGSFEDEEVANGFAIAIQKPALTKDGKQKYKKDGVTPAKPRTKYLWRNIDDLNKYVPSEPKLPGMIFRTSAASLFEEIASHIRLTTNNLESDDIVVESSAKTVSAVLVYQFLLNLGETFRSLVGSKLARHLIDVDTFMTVIGVRYGSFSTDSKKKIKDLIDAATKPEKKVPKNSKPKAVKAENGKLEKVVVPGEKVVVPVKAEAPVVTVDGGKK